MLRREIIGSLGAAAAMSMLAGKASANPANRDVLVTIFLRGAADGLNILPPYKDDFYKNARPSIRITEADAIDVDGYFGIHPAFESLNAYLNSQESGNTNMAFVPAAGNAAGSHSHFDAMMGMEYANGTFSGQDGGWLGRYLSASEPVVENAVARGIAISSTVQDAYLVTDEYAQYSANVIAAVDSEAFQLNYGDAGAFRASLAALYGRQTELDVQATALLNFLEKNETLRPWEREPGAAYPAMAQGLGPRMQAAADFISAYSEVEVVNLDMGGWDTHSNEPNRLNSLLTELAASLEAFCRDMKDSMDNITILVMTEFGRRIRENNSVGTDHGTGSCMIALGGGVNGGVHAGHWHEDGLVKMQTHHGDVLAKVDYRDVFAQLMQRRLNYAGDWEYAFPGHGLNELGFDLFNYR